ncbi:DUF58 domain-containing protein [Babesia caballi]|uniref:DUF58 domain-containing protein n=1 Tax=Babesia caballi TaxID=5871 RepID=A0AAV4LSF6_BABCB|nr:DUF58 domain-containing protein [Babesia caballi]
MDMLEEIPELRCRCEAHQPVEHLSDGGRGPGACGPLLVLMAEVRCGAEVESGEEIVIGGGGGRTLLPGSEALVFKVSEEVDVGCGGAIGCGGVELLKFLERRTHNLGSTLITVKQSGLVSHDTHENLGLRAAKCHGLPSVFM